ncbi:MAG: TIR domain-containing protein, partial [Sphingobacteriales bacterium]
MQFTTDIFISYAHIDDEALIENQKGWISDFHRALDIRLAQLLGRRPIIWRDQALQGNHVFDKQIIDQFSNVAIMLSILTPRYARSEWCVREVNEFYEACQQNIGFNINNTARVFKIIKTPVRIDMHPEKIQNVLGYEFYSTDPATGRTKELSQTFGQHIETAYWDKLDDLAHDICAFLENIEYPQSGSVKIPSAAGTAVVPKEEGKIFLCESSYDTQEFRDSLKRELQGYGYQIYPDKQLPLMASPLKDSVIQYLDNSKLAIHLVGENYGIVPEGAQKSIVEIQNDLASSYSAATSMPRLIWVPENSAPVDDRQIAFVDKLSRGGDGVTGADLIKGNLEEFKSIVIDKLNAMKQKEAAKKPEPVAEADSDGGESASKVIYLICDMQDLEAIQPLEDYLFDNGYEV